MKCVFRTFPVVLPPWTKHPQKAALGLTLGQGAKLLERQETGRGRTQKLDRATDPG